jgi:hypothetical protein
MLKIVNAQQPVAAAQPANETLPPVPVTVTNRTFGLRMRSHNAARSAARPMSGVGCAGSLP